MSRPQQVSDSAIRSIIEELRLPHRAPSGAAVRKVLAARFGVRASTSRVYRLLRTPPPPLTPDEIALRQSERSVRELIEERDAALRRAELSELREQATQDRMGMQIDELRERLRGLGVDPLRLK
jgi:hypothetical protein